MSDPQFLAKQKHVMDLHTAQQRSEIENRNAQLGDAGRAKAENQWASLIQRVATEMANGTNPSDPKVKALAAEWQGLLDQFAGGDKKVEENLAQMYKAQPEKALQFGMGPSGAMIDYLKKAKSP